MIGNIPIQAAIGRLIAAQHAPAYGFDYRNDSLTPRE